MIMAALCKQKTKDTYLFIAEKNQTLNHSYFKLHFNKYYFNGYAYLVPLFIIFTSFK